MGRKKIKKDYTYNEDQFNCLKGLAIAKQELLTIGSITYSGLRNPEEVSLVDLTGFLFRTIGDYYRIHNIEILKNIPVQVNLTMGDMWVKDYNLDKKKRRRH